MKLVDYKERLLHLPESPGIYQMINAQDQAIYVGKARNLKKRLSQYFQKKVSHKTQIMMSHVVRIETTVTPDENEALLLEANIIKSHKPKYNILLRDDKSYPYLYMSTKDPFPRLDFYRGSCNRKGRYFGPYPNARAVRDSLSLIQKLFKLRQCSNIFFTHRTRPCLQYQINRCTAPCVAYVSQSEYQKQTQGAILFLEGRNEAVIEKLSEYMQGAAEKQHYEQAAIYRNQIKQLRELQKQQIMVSGSGNIDVLSAKASAHFIAFSILSIRSGRVVGNKTFCIEMQWTDSICDAWMQFLPQYYLNPIQAHNLPDRIVIDHRMRDRLWIENAFQLRWNRSIHIIDRNLKPYRHWQAMAQANAQAAMIQKDSKRNYFHQGLKALQKHLKIANPMNRIECFDISHMMGEHTRAACVVFDEQGPLKKSYRHFRISGIQSGDDYAALNQALMRRYTKLKTEDGIFPDLIIMDGGWGQLKQAVSVLEELQVSGVPILGIAKGPNRKPGLEKIYYCKKRVPFSWNSDDPALHLIQQIRDEAHRFAIKGYRRAHIKKQNSSILEAIPGIGPKRRQRLFNYFGGLQNLLKARYQEIEQVPYISKSMAKWIYRQLHQGD